MARIEAEGELLAPRLDVWELISEPYHLPDWWPAYTGVEPDRRGLADGARWTVRRSDAPGFLRRPGGEALILIKGVDPTLGFGWLDVPQRLEARIDLANAAADRTRATIAVEGAWWRLNVEGARHLPQQALLRLHDLCQTAAEL